MDLNETQHPDLWKSWNLLGSQEYALLYWPKNWKPRVWNYLSSPWNCLAWKFQTSGFLFTFTRILQNIFLFGCLRHGYNEDVRLRKENSGKLFLGCWYLVKIVTPKCKTHFAIEVVPFYISRPNSCGSLFPMNSNLFLNALNFHLVLREQVLLWVTSWNLKSPGFERVALKNCVQHVFTTTVAYGYSYLWCLRAVLWLFFFLESRRECSCSGLSNWITSIHPCNRWIINAIHIGVIFGTSNQCSDVAYVCKKEEHPKRMIKDRG